MKYFGELRGVDNIFEDTERVSDIFLVYSTSNMCINIMAQLCNGGEKSVHVFERRPQKRSWGNENVYHNLTFQPAQNVKKIK